MVRKFSWKCGNSKILPFRFYVKSFFALFGSFESSDNCPIPLKSKLRIKIASEQILYAPLIFGPLKPQPNENEEFRVRPKKYREIDFTECFVEMNFNTSLSSRVFKIDIWNQDIDAGDGVGVIKETSNLS